MKLDSIPLISMGQILTLSDASWNDHYLNNELIMDKKNHPRHIVIYDQLETNPKINYSTSEGKYLNMGEDDVNVTKPWLL